MKRHRNKLSGIALQRHQCDIHAVAGGQDR
jgi:hypothetical protein